MSYLAPLGTKRPSFSWGYYPSGGTHRALDFAVPLGTPVRAANDGYITTSGWSSTGFGWQVRLRMSANGHTVLYAHLSRRTVSVGARVRRGQIIGYTGSTGNSSGPHLHMEVRKSSWYPLTSYNFTSMLSYGTSTITTTKPTIRTASIRPGYRNAEVKKFNALLWNKMGATYRATRATAWNNEAADYYGPIAQQVCWDLYNWLYKSNPGTWGPPPSKPCWPGPQLIRYIGGIPI